MSVGLDAILAEKIPCKPGYWLARFLDKINSEMKAMEKVRIKLLEKYAKKDKNGKPEFRKDKDGKQLEPPQYDLINANKQKFEKEFADLGEETFEIDFKVINLEDIDTEVCEKCGRKKLTIKPVIWYQLGKIIKINKKGK